MRMLLLAFASLMLLAGLTSAQAQVYVDIDLGSQTMHVDSSEGSYDWRISSARSGYVTPEGDFRPTHLEPMHYSKKYDDAPMPHAIFFLGGFAIHGTYETAELGRPASHGCVRISPGHAALLYELVESEGAEISIHGSPPASRPFASAARYAGGRRRHWAGIPAPERPPVQDFTGAGFFNSAD